jgi:hypothetical protein
MSPQPYTRVAAGYATALMLLLLLFALFAPERHAPAGSRGTLVSEPQR